MAARILPHVDVLRQLFEYNPDTGELRHKATPPGFFSSPAKDRARNTRCAGKLATSRQGSMGYLTVYILGQNYLAHRVAYKLAYGVEPPPVLDHANGNGEDNRLCNLRASDKATNGWNRRAPRTNTTGYKGVFFDKRDGRYYARICVRKKLFSLGRYSAAEDAHAAYAKAALLMHGEFANTN